MDGVKLTHKGRVETLPQTSPQVFERFYARGKPGRICRALLVLHIRAYLYCACVKISGLQKDRKALWTWVVKDRYK